MNSSSRSAVFALVIAVVGFLAIDGARALLGERWTENDRAPLPSGTGVVDPPVLEVAIGTGRPADGDTASGSPGEARDSQDPEIDAAGDAGGDVATEVASDPPSSDDDIAASEAGDPGESDGLADPDPVDHDGAHVTVVAPADPGAPAPGTDDRFAVFPGKRLAKGPWVVARSALAERIRASLADKRLVGAKISVAVVAAADGTSLFAKDADESLIVASNKKLLTTAAALHLLGPEFEFTTRLCASGALAGGTLAGDLIVVGDGDPDVLPANPSEKTSLAGRIAAALLGAGVRHVTGDLVIDDLVFDRQYHPPQWRKDQLPHDYAAPVAGFSLYENCLVVTVKPAPKVGALASVTLLPRSSALAPEVALKTGTAKSKNAIHVPAPVAPGRVKVSGQTPHGSSPVPLYLPLANPGETHPTALKEALERAGVRIDGAARLATTRTEVKGIRVIATVETPLSTVLRKLNKESSNPLAEHVYKRVGFAAHGAGTCGNAGKAVLDTLRHHGIDTAGAASADGSGLSRGNTFTARQIALLLRAMWTGPGRDLVVDSLPISGVDGTLSKRLTQEAYKGRVRAKTGYIAGVSTLSGYAASESGEVFCFSILVNGVKGATAAKAVQDAICKLLADVGSKTP